MTRERINDFKEIVLPSISKLLSDINYEGQGKCDAEEFTNDFNEILDLAAKALEQEPIYYPPCQDCHTKMNEIVRAYDNVKSLDDAISRQVVKEQMLKYGFHAPDMTVTELIEDLPPVLPKREQNVLDKIRAEIEQNAYPIVHGVNNHEKGMTLYGILQIIDKYKAENKEQ